MDTYQRRIQVFDTTAGEFSIFPADDHPLTSPVGIVIDKGGRIYISDSDGNIYVVDALFDNIQIFDKTG